MSRINGDASALYQEIWGADLQPTASQTEALAKVETEADELMKRWKEFKATDLAGLNRELKDSNAPEIHPQTEQHEEPVGDEE
jgi:isochorismate hydrolase